MIDQKVTFEMVFPIEPYRNFKLSIEGSIEPDETYLEAVQKAFQKVMAGGDKIYAELRLPISSQSSVAHLGPDNRIHPIPPPEAVIRDIQVEKEPGTEVQSAIQEIYHCKDLKELESFRVILNTKAAKTFPALQEAYDTMYQKLSK